MIHMELKATQNEVTYFKEISHPLCLNVVFLSQLKVHILASDICLLSNEIDLSVLTGRNNLN